MRIAVQQACRRRFVAYTGRWEPHRVICHPNASNTFTSDARRPTAAERLKQADCREQPSEPDLREQILRSEERLLRIEQRDQVERPLAKPCLRDIDGRIVLRVPKDDEQSSDRSNVSRLRRK